MTMLVAGNQRNRCCPQEAGQPEMAEKLSGNVGWGIGLEFRESNHLLRTRTTAVCRPGMAFNVVVGARGLTAGHDWMLLLYVSSLWPQNPGHLFFCGSCYMACPLRAGTFQHTTVDTFQGHTGPQLTTVVQTLARAQAWRV